jgi:hypothetical protein
MALILAGSRPTSSGLAGVRAGTGFGGSGFFSSGFGGAGGVGSAGLVTATGGCLSQPRSIFKVGQGFREGIGAGVSHLRFEEIKALEVLEAVELGEACVGDFVWKRLIISSFSRPLR